MFRSVVQNSPISSYLLTVVSFFLICSELCLNHTLTRTLSPLLRCVSVCCSVLQFVAVCCSVLQCAAVCCSGMLCVAVCCCALQRVAVCHEVPSHKPGMQTLPDYYWIMYISPLLTFFFQGGLGVFKWCETRGTVFTT